MQSGAALWLDWQAILLLGMSDSPCSHSQLQGERMPAEKQLVVQLVPVRRSGLARSGRTSAWRPSQVIPDGALRGAAPYP